MEKIELENKGVFSYTQDDWAGDLDNFIIDYPSKIALIHPEYNLPNNTELESPEEVLKAVKRYKKEYVFPVIMYDHSGIAFSTDRKWPFNCPWDASFCGFIWFTAKQRKEIKDCTKKWSLIESANNHLAMLNAWFRGDVYVFNYENYKTGEDDSLGGVLCVDRDAFEGEVKDFLSGHVGLKDKDVKEIVDQL